MTRPDQKTLVKIAQAVSGRLLRRRRGSGGRAVNRRLRRVARLLLLVLHVLLLVLVVFLGRFVDEALIVLGVLQVAFRQDAVASGSGIARESDILFVDLIGRAADADIGAVAVERVDTRIDAAILPIVVVVATAAVVVAAVTAAAHASCVLIVSHADVRFTSF